MQMRKVAGLLAVSILILLPGASIAGEKFDGNWTTHLACEAHGETPAYKWEFPSVIKDGVFHGQHWERGGPGYLVIDGKISEDGSAKLVAKGTVEKNNAHGIFAMKGNNYGYDIKGQFGDAKGTGARNEGAGLLGRPCTFEFVKQVDAPPAAAQWTATGVSTIIHAWRTIESFIPKPCAKFALTGAFRAMALETLKSVY